MQQGEASLADVRALLNAYPQGATERDEVCGPCGPPTILIRSSIEYILSPPQYLLVMAYLVYTTAHDYSPSHLQDDRLPYDLALEFGGSAQLLGLLQPGSAAWSEGYQQANDPLVTAAESRVFESLSRLLDPNPRRLKRIISVYALATEVAKRTPLPEGDSKARKAISIPP